MVAITESSDEEEFQDEEVNAGSRKRRASRGSVSYKEDDDNEEEESSDDDDDVPLASLKAPSPAKKKKAAATKSKAKTTAKAKAPPKKKAKTSASTKSTSSSSGNDYSSPSFALYGTESIKGKLIQNLLCRWWYAISWPDPSGIPKEPPTDYDAMDGFPGVFICTQGEEVGTIKDFRNKDEAPTFNNFARKPSTELKELLVKAINEQKRQLVEAEGAGTDTEKELNSMLKWATKVNATKADKEAEKVFKANKFTIPQ